MEEMPSVETVPAPVEQMPQEPVEKPVPIAAEAAEQPNPMEKGKAFLAGKLDGLKAQFGDSQQRETWKRALLATAGTAIVTMDVVKQEIGKYPLLQKYAHDLPDTPQDFMELGIVLACMYGPRLIKAGYEYVKQKAKAPSAERRFAAGAA